MSSAGNAAHPVGYKSHSTRFLNLKFLGGVWQAIAKTMAVWRASNIKKRAKLPLQSAANCHTQPDHPKGIIEALFGLISRPIPDL
jgi:hypothetical protein